MKKIILLLLLGLSFCDQQETGKDPQDCPKPPPPPPPPPPPFNDW